MLELRGTERTIAGRRARETESHSERARSSTAANDLRRAAARGEALPERFARAEARRPKVTDLSGGMVRAVESEAAPEELLREGIEAVAHAKFVGKGDQGKVQGMLREVEFVMWHELDTSGQHQLSLGPCVHKL